jgi:hypothetical protein
MGTVALEFVPPDRDQGPARAAQTAERVRARLASTGLAERVNALLIPGTIPEDDDRPLRLAEKLDVLEVHRATREALPLHNIVTQVTAFSTPEQLDERVAALRAAGVERAVFVGVPRTLADGAGPGMTPVAALRRYADRLAGRGVVLIPTRDAEAARFGAKLAAGANLALCQLLFSDQIARVLAAVEVAGTRPEVLLSFGYVAKVEARTGLIRWLIRDATAAAQREMQTVLEIAGKPFAAKKAALVEIYRRVIDGVHDLGWPLGVHFECPYDFNPYAFEVFHAMLDVWSPDA